MKGAWIITMIILYGKQIMSIKAFRITFFEFLTENIFNDLITSIVFRTNSKRVGVSIISK